MKKYKFTPLKPKPVDWKYRGHTIHEFIVSFDRDDVGYMVDGYMDEDFDTLDDAMKYIDEIKD